ncbi:MAG: hypothetical protein CSA62_05285 [Planctomycetota bacterium]|nr:MAG: hypothetical protein CSA62_05285 [Planctomycetota bacterium]
MSENPKSTASPYYALSRLQRALEAAVEHPDSGARQRAKAKAERWRAVIEGMLAGSLEIGSRTPVAGTPAWVTLEVAHGGFATGRYLAEGELLPHELALLEELPAAVPGDTPRARLNEWFCSDAGLRRLAEAVESGTLHVDLPEEGALPVLAALLQRGCEAEALELLAKLRPLMHRLRFYPQLRSKPRPAGACVRRRSVGEVAERLRATREPSQVAAMNEALGVWNPLFDRLVALWLETLDPADPEGAPHFRRDADTGKLLRQAENGQPMLAGGQPGAQWPEGWAERRRAWLEDYAAAAASHHFCGKHRHRRSNFSRLREALEAELASLDAAERRRLLAGVRLALAGTLSKHGAPGSTTREGLRQVQEDVVASPLFSQLARVVADRLARYPADGGLPSLEGLGDPVSVEEAAVQSLPVGAAVPAQFVAKAELAIEAPIPELIERGVIPSGEVLAMLLPQLSAEIAAAGIEDSALASLFGQIYAAFRRRRSLLLLDLSKQVQLEELPWIAALERFRHADLGAQAKARQALEQISLLALCAFPQTILPNPLLREMGELARRAELKLPLLEELAADIFVGKFQGKWAEAADLALSQLEGSFYARYYDLPAADHPLLHPRGRSRGKPSAKGFLKLCKQRAAEAQSEHGGQASWVASNGSILEQSQILTTQNLAVLSAGLGLTEQLRALAPELVQQIFTWILRCQRQSPSDLLARLRRTKNAAYAWRQALYLLSLLSEDEQNLAVYSFADQLAKERGDWVARFQPALTGLQLILEGGRFDASGRGQTYAHAEARRFLGWSVGPHWMLSPGG